MRTQIPSAEKQLSTNEPILQSGLRPEGLKQSELQRLTRTRPEPCFSRAVRRLNGNPPEPTLTSIGKPRRTEPTGTSAAIGLVLHREGRANILEGSDLSDS